MKIINLVVVLGLVFGGNISANAAEDDFGLDDISFEDEKNIPSDADKIADEAQPKIDIEETKLDEVIKDIDADIPTEAQQDIAPTEEKSQDQTPEVAVEATESVVEEKATPDNIAADEPKIESENDEEQPAAKEENVSDYIKKLDLSDEQLDEAKFISSEMEMRQEQLQKSVDLLKTQAREIEEQSLREFEAILTPTQKKVFEELRQINAQASDGE
jgi:hypothetical protein